MDSLFAQFLKEKQYVDDASTHTLRSYQQSYNAWKNLKGELSDDGLLDFIVAIRHAKLKPNSCNVYIRSLNVFFFWLHANGHAPKHYKLRKLKIDQTVFKVFTDQHIKAILRYKPDTFYKWRLWAATCLLMTPACG